MPGHRLSSALDNSRQLFKLNNTVSSVNCKEHGPFFGPRVQPQLSRRYFFTFSTTSSKFLLLVQSRPSRWAVTWDVGTRGRGEVGTRGRGEVGTRGRGDVETRGLGEV